ncbi:uncharacterized protein LOC129605375 isoform X1 [Condylostylus longicornis]|uniref:uncharacterized protein LOC129605375 isoform X1 n=1 Tax=Condylostylus longicornis TaxID=2530218 RepID=UPI00244E23EC|nr:uncharacterized protein LOC129605375 isoform X1 [Condylostylus longicornis]
MLYIMKRELFARAGRSRFLIGIGIFIITIGFLVIFNNSQQQLDESRILRLRCEQQHDALNARLQAIIDHKFSLEKNLEKERKEHLETKKFLELKVKAAKENSVKQTQDSSARFDSLQQHYKLLQSEHNDLVEDCAKTKKNQLEQINMLERKVKSLQNQNQLTKTNKEKEIEEWKLKYQTLQHEKERLDILLKTTRSSESCQKQNEHFQTIIKDYKANCDYQPIEKLGPSVPAVLPIPAAISSHQHNHFIASNEKFDKDTINKVEKSFKEQQIVSENLYKIPIIITNKTYATTTSTTIAPLILNTPLNTNKLENLAEDSYKKTLDSPISYILNSFKYKGKVGVDSAIINSVENFQIAPKPLIESSADNDAKNNKNSPNNAGFQQPPPLNMPVGSSSTSTQSGIKNEKRALSVASLSSQKGLLGGSTSSSTTTASNRLKEPGVHPIKVKQLPKGVAPVPENFDVLLKNNQDESDPLKDKTKKVSDEETNGDDNAGGETKDTGDLNGANNRYANVVDDFPNAGVGPEPDSNKKDEEDNAAHEMKDTDFGEEGKDHLQQALDNVNNAAEDDNQNNFYDTKVGHQNKKHDGLDLIDNMVDGESDIIGHLHQSRNKHDHGVGNKDEGILNANDKLINEVVGDQGKEQAFPDGMHLEEQNEEDEDEDDYSMLAARKLVGAAIRN